MNFDSNLPIYIQIMDIIKKRIISSELKSGDKLESVRELSLQLKVNPNTIQRAYQELERESLVFTQRGTGTFVTEDDRIIKDLKIQLANDIIQSFLSDIRDFGLSDEEIIEIIEREIRREKDE